VAGRSPLEYLNDNERERQRRVVVELMGRPPPSIDALAHDFVNRIDQCP
jgi:hypothetical protein